MGCGEEGGWSPFVLTTLSCLVYISPFFPSPTVLILDSEQYSTSDIPLIEYIITTHTDMLRSHPYKYLSPIFYKHQSLSPKNVLWKHCFFFFFLYNFRHLRFLHPPLIYSSGGLGQSHLQLHVHYCCCHHTLSWIWSAFIWKHIC